MKILDRMPYLTVPSAVTVRGEAVRVKPYQLVVWVSVGARDASEWDARTPRFPAILDTGNNHNFAIGRGQLQRWTGLHPESLEASRAIWEGGKRVPLHAANVWLHRNRPKSREMHPYKYPYRLRIKDGIAIYPDESAFRLPILGLRALTANELRTVIDGKRRQTTVSTASPWWRPFG